MFVPEFVFADRKNETDFQDFFSIFISVYVHMHATPWEASRGHQIRWHWS